MWLVSGCQCAARTPVRRWLIKSLWMKSETKELFMGSLCFVKVLQDVRGHAVTCCYHKEFHVPSFIKTACAASTSCSQKHVNIKWNFLFAVWHSVTPERTTLNVSDTTGDVPSFRASQGTRVSAVSFQLLFLHLQHRPDPTSDLQHRPDPDLWVLLLLPSSSSQHVVCECRKSSVCFRSERVEIWLLMSSAGVTSL